MTKRNCCCVCFRPEKTCLCKHVQGVNNQVELIILQHPQEEKVAKNTGLLLHLCLAKSQRHIGEIFTPAFFNQMNLGEHYDLLLYPSTPEETSMGLITPPEIDWQQLNPAAQSNKPLRLWVLDATWRKSRKMLYLNPSLQRMPRLALENPPVSGYSIRKAHHEHQLSSLEASCYALRQLEQNQVDYTPIFQAFASFIAEQKAFLPLSPTLDSL